MSISIISILHLYVTLGITTPIHFFFFRNSIIPTRVRRNNDSEIICKLSERRGTILRKQYNYYYYDMIRVEYHVLQ